MSLSEHSKLSEHSRLSKTSKLAKLFRAAVLPLCSVALLCVCLTGSQREALGEEKSQLWGNNKGVEDIVTGTLLGQPFTVERGDCNSTSVVLRDGRNASGNGIKRIAISFPKAVHLENSRFIVTSGGKVQWIKPDHSQGTFEGIVVTRGLNTNPKEVKSTSSAKNYTMTLQFFPIKENYLPGNINLKVDGEGTSVKGYFYCLIGKDEAVFF